MNRLIFGSHYHMVAILGDKYLLKVVLEEF